MNAKIAKIATALLLALALFSCDIGMSSSDKGSITMRLPDQSQLSGSASADSLDGVSRSVSSGGSISAGTVDQFKVVVRNLSSQQNITQIVAPGSSVTIDDLEPGSWDVAIFGYDTAGTSGDPIYYGNARGIPVEGGETSSATVSLRHIVGTSGLGLNLAVPQSGGAPSTFNRNDIVKAYVSYTGNELSQSGAVFYDVSLLNSDGSLVSGQTDGQNYQLNVPLPDFLEPGYSYSAKVYLFVHDPLSGEGDCALWGGSVSGTAQSDAKLEGSLAFLDHHLAKKAGPSTNVDIKMDKALAQQLETITGATGTTGYKFMESAVYDAATSDEKSYSNMSVYPAITNLCGIVPVIVECDGMAWTDNFTFKHPSQIPSIAVPGVNSDSKLYIPAFVSRALGTPSLYPSAPTQWKKCQVASSYDEYGFKKYSASGFDEDSWGAPFQYEAVDTNDDITYTAPNIFLPINDSGYDTFKCKTTIAAGTYGYFEDDDSATTKNISVEFDVYGAAWTVTGPASVLPNTDFTLELSNSAATSSELQTVANDAPTGALSASVGSNAVSGAITATLSGNKILVTIPGQDWLSNMHKTITLSYGSDTLGSVTVLVAQPSGGVSGNIDLYVSASGTSDGEGSAANPYATLQKAFDYIMDTPNPNADYIIHITGTIMGTSYIADEAGKTVKAKSVTLLGTSALVSGEPQDVLDGKDIASPVLAVVSQGLNVTIRNLKITNEMRGKSGSCGLVVGDETIASSVVLDGGVYIVDCLGMGNGAAITICKNSSVTMKDGCLVDNTSTGIGSCGGVYINQGSFLMQGGTISNISAKDGKTAVCAYGRFEMSGNAIVSSSGGNYVVVPVAPSETTPGTYTVPYPVVIAGDLTQSSAATISPGGGGPFDLATYQNGLQIVAEASAGLLANNYTKFAVVQEYGSSVTWTINQNGQLDDGSSGGGGTSGNVVNLYVNSLSGYGSDSNNGLSEDSALMTLGAAFDKMTDSTKDYVVNVMSKIWQDGLTSDFSQLEISSGVRANSIKITGTNADSDERVITGQYDYAGPGTVMKVTSSVPVTIESITITGGCSDSDHKGGCIEIGSGATVILGNDTYIQGGMVNGGFGGGVYVSADSTFIMKGNSVVQADQYSAVYLEEGAKIMIGSNLTGRTSDSIPYVAQITPASYSSTTAKIGIVSGSETSLAAEHDKFAVTSITQSATTVNYIINESGMLEEVAGGSGGGGSGNGVNGNFVQKPFSVSATKQVYFSQGNLQYQGSTSTWRFAEHQYDVVPKDKLIFTLINSTYEEWIDLFGWGSSGYNGVYPYTRDYSATYGGDTLQNKLRISDMTTGDNANYDWGVYNAISNGGNQPGLWRTLTKDEWLYLINTRDSSLRVCAKIKENADSTATLAGVILLPDDWTAPSDVTLAATPTGGYNNNTLTYAEWEKLEAAGAVFLPALGYQADANEFYSRGDDANNSAAYFEYWSATGTSDDSGKYCVQTYNSGYSFDQYQTNGANHYIPVRLVQDVN